MAEDTNQPEAKIKFSVKNKEFEISGTESFVTEQISNFKDIIQGSLGKILIDSTKAETTASNYHFIERSHDEHEAIEVEYEESSTDNKGSGVSCDNVIVIDGDRVKVIADVPGENTSQKMINVIILYMWGKLQLGVDSLSFKELRSICEEYGEVDKPNFSAIINKQKKLFLTSKAQGGQVAKLIRPGIKSAEELIKQLNNVG